MKERHHKRETRKENDQLAGLGYREAAGERDGKRVPLFLLFLISRKSQNSDERRKKSEFRQKSEKWHPCIKEDIGGGTNLKKLCHGSSKEKFSKF